MKSVPTFGTRREQGSVDPCTGAPLLIISSGEGRLGIVSGARGRSLERIDGGVGLG